ncbi:DUF4226 domain-containing protein [Mycobacterium tuberculosis]
MPDETGLGADAARAREVALTQHIGVSAETDRAVVPKLRQAYDAWCAVAAGLASLEPNRERGGPSARAGP